MNNLADKQPDLVKELAAQYERWARRCGMVPWRELGAKK